MTVRTRAAALIEQRGSGTSALSAGITALLVIVCLGAVERLLGLEVFALPFVASAALIALAPSAPAARPGAVLRAYPAAAVGAMLITAAVGASEVAVTASAVWAVIAMAILRAPHVPAALCAAGIGLTDPGFGYLAHTLVPAMAVVVAASVAAGPAARASLSRWVRHPWFAGRRRPATFTG
ncbi:hypothetical protein ACFWPA_05470 [Rhodococcus sp. NPDC058505]|uniref:HPP family protein n=1 Tax=Rhodococcus sp. NPDC058505 TaxID=3346531 RepID=UPI0036628A0F